MYQLLLIAAAVIPALWLLIRVYRADRLEKEPARLLLWLVILGVIATALASVTEQLGEMVLTSVFPEENIFYIQRKGYMVSEIHSKLISTCTELM